MDQLQKGSRVAKHTTMKPRHQNTPHGPVVLQSRWMRDRYMLVASGSTAALRLLFPRHQGPFESISPTTVRHVFVPANIPITVERELRNCCAKWQMAWDELLLDANSQSCTGSKSAAPNITTVGHLFDHLFEIRKATLRPTTTERDRYHISLWRKELSESALSALDEDALLSARANIAKSTSASTANDGFAILKTYLMWACNKGLMPNAFFKTIRRLRIPPAERSQREWWTTPEVELALRCARQDEQARTAVLYIAICCFLGLRPEEAIMLRWKDLELDTVDPVTGDRRPVAHITPHDGWTPKDGEARDIPISNRLLQLLEEFRCPDGYLLEAQVKRTKRKADAPWAYRYDPKKIWKRVNDRVVEAGGKAITAYGMRHTFASNLLIANVSEFKVAKWLGHSDTRMVHKHYGHLRSYDADINATNNQPPRASA